MFPKNTGEAIASDSRFYDGIALKTVRLVLYCSLLYIYLIILFYRKLYSNTCYFVYNFRGTDRKKDSTRCKPRVNTHCEWKNKPNSKRNCKNCGSWNILWRYQVCLKFCSSLLSLYKKDKQFVTNNMIYKFTCEKFSSKIKYPKWVQVKWAQLSHICKLYTLTLIAFSYAFATMFC